MSADTMLARLIAAGAVTYGNVGVELSGDDIMALSELREQGLIHIDRKISLGAGMPAPVNVTMTVTPAVIAPGTGVEGQPCPAGCGWPLVWCGGDACHPDHLQCQGCAQDATADCPCDCGPDLATCAYYRRANKLPGYDPEGTCSFGCVDEPACLTEEPMDGWPSVRCDR